MRMQGFGLSKQERLLKSFQYKNVYAQRNIRKSSLLWIYTQPNGLTFNRIGISVSNKTCANLVIRNRIKRLAKEVFRLNKNRFGKGMDIVFVFKRGPKDLDKQILDATIKNMF